MPWISYPFRIKILVIEMVYCKLNTDADIAEQQNAIELPDVYKHILEKEDYCDLMATVLELNEKGHNLPETINKLNKLFANVIEEEKKKQSEANIAYQ